MAMFAAALTALLLFLMHPSRWYALALAVAFGAGFAVRELRAGQPFIDIRVLGGNLPLLATYARNVLTFVVSYTFLYGYTQWLEAGRGLSPSAAGLLLLPMFGVAIVAASVTGRHRPVRGKLVVGGAAQVVACAMLLLVHPASPIWLLVLGAVVVGVPQGLNSLANQNALYYQADPARMAHRPACCGPPRTSAPSSPRPRAVRSSAAVSTPPACTNWPGSSSAPRRSSSR
jgi:hypothetical protein